MHQTMMREVIILIGLLGHFLAFANGLNCVHCRMDLCTHDYCQQSQLLFNSSSDVVGSYVEIEEWANIPTCPENLEDRNKPEFTQTCSQKASSCGLFNYKVVTKNLPKIVPGNQSAVHVVAGGSKSFESSVVVLGCVNPDFKCKTGLTQTVDVPVAQNTSSQSQIPSTDDVKINRLEITNKESNCCKCQGELCNNKGELKDCNTNILTNQAPHDIPVPANGVVLSTTSFLIMCTVSMLFA